MADKTQGRVVYTALIMPLSSHATFPKPTPKPPGGGGGGQPGAPGAPDQTLPGDLPRPEHPIWFPLPPDAPVDPDYGVPIEHPDQGLPQPPTGGGAPPQPSHPIVLPPDSEGGWGPIYIWGGGPGARPPIEIPGAGEEPEEGAKIEWKAAWTPTTGWVSFGIVIPGGEHVTPSKAKK